MKLFKKAVQKRREQLLQLESEIDIALQNMHYAKFNLPQISEDYMYTDLCKMWKKRKSINHGLLKE